MDGLMPEGVPQGNASGAAPVNLAGRADVVRTSDAPSRAMAGLQGGMVGVLWMLAWLGVSAKWQQASFWSAENLFATAFWGGNAIRPGFVRYTFSGLALYLLLYSGLGAAFAVAARRLSRSMTLPVAVVFAVVWYFVSFRWMMRNFIPLAFLLHTETPTLIGHLLYGTFLGRFPIYLEEPGKVEPPAPAASLPASIGPVPGEPALEAPAPVEEIGDSGAPEASLHADQSPESSEANSAPARSSSPQDPA